MSEKRDNGLLAGTQGTPGSSHRTLLRFRWAGATLILGLALGIWIGGGPDRYGETEGFVGGLRGACRSMVKGGRYTAASLLDLVFQQRSSVRNLGLAQQVETRIWQDKRLVAEGIVVDVEEEGTVVLKGLVTDKAHKEMAVALAQDTRGVARVVDELAVSPASRTIDVIPAPAVPTGVATGVTVRR